MNLRPRDRNKEIGGDFKFKAQSTSERLADEMVA
jgi:hypothetical protein